MTIDRSRRRPIGLAVTAGASTRAKIEAAGITITGKDPLPGMIESFAYMRGVLAAIATSPKVIEYEL